MGGRQERTMVLPNSKESGRNEMGRKKQERRNMKSRIRFRHTGLNSTLQKKIGKYDTGKCDCCVQEGMQLIVNLGKI